MYRRLSLNLFLSVVAVLHVSLFIKVVVNGFPLAFVLLDCVLSGVTVGLCVCSQEILWHMKSRWVTTTEWL